MRKRRTLGAATKDNYCVAPGEVRPLCGTQSASGSVPTILRSSQHGCSRFTPVGIRYSVIAKSGKRLLVAPGLSLGESPTHEEAVSQNSGCRRLASEHAVILACFNVIRRHKK